MTGESTSSETRLPWTLVGALLVAMAAHWFTVEGFLGLPICGAALAASQFASWRLSSSRGLSWSLRAIVFTFITMLIGFPSESFYQWYMKPEYTHLVGCLLSAEVAIRAWETQDPSKWRQTRGIMLLLAILIFAVATNTGIRKYIHTLAPPFVLLIVLSLRSFTQTRQPRAGLVVIRVAMMLIAVAIGFVAVQTVTTFDQKITTWAVDLFSQRRGRSSEIGLNGSPRLSNINNPQMSMDRALIIQGPRGERYLRAIAFDTLENRQWKRTLRERHFRQIDSPRIGPDTEGDTLTFTRIGETLDLLPLPPHVAGIEAGHFLEQDDSGAVRDQDTGLVGSASRYIARVPKDEKHQGPVLTPLDGEAQRRALKIPDELDPKVIELARQVAGEGDPMMRLARLSMHLRSNNAYSLSYTPSGSDPLSDFVLNKRAAHCQYFGSALVVMSRAVGIPSRFVTGYLAHEPYGDDTTVVRQRDAHAWAECWIDGVGWVTLDATPASGRPDEMFTRASTWRRAWEWVSDVPGKLRDWLGQFSAKGLILLILAAGSILPLTAFWRFVLRRWRRRNADPSEYAKPSMDLVAAAKRFEACLKRRGVTCAANRTWRDCASTLDPACAEFVEVYDEARFGGRNGETLDRVRRLLDDIERASQVGHRPPHSWRNHGPSH